MPPPFVPKPQQPPQAAAQPHPQQCGTCGERYDDRTRRCVRDACGHYRCFFCVFQGRRCVYCSQLAMQPTSILPYSSHHHPHNQPGPQVPPPQQKTPAPPVVTQPSFEEEDEDEVYEDVNSDNHYYLYQPTPASEAAAGGVPSSLSLGAPSGADIASQRLMTPIAEEDFSDSDDSDFHTRRLHDTLDVSADHIYCTISDDDRYDTTSRLRSVLGPPPPPQQQQQPIETGGDSLPEITRPSIGFAPRLPPRASGAAASGPNLSPNSVSVAASLRGSNANKTDVPLDYPRLSKPDLMPSDSSSRLNKSSSLSNVATSLTTATSAVTYSPKLHRRSTGPAPLSKAPPQTTQPPQFSTLPVGAVNPFEPSGRITESHSLRIRKHSAGGGDLELKPFTAANFEIPDVSGGFWQAAMRWDVVQFGLDSTLVGRGWIFNSVEDSLFQPSFEGDILCKGALLTGAAGSGKTHLIVHLALNSHIAHVIFSDVRSRSASDSHRVSRESLDSARDKAQDSNQSSLKSLGSGVYNPNTGGSGGYNPGTAGSGGGYSAGTGGSGGGVIGGGNSLPRKDSPLKLQSSGGSSSKNSPSSTVDSGIKASPSNTLSTTDQSEPTSAAHALSRRVIGCFFIQPHTSLGTLVHTLMYQCSEKIAQYKALVESDGRLQHIIAPSSCSRDPLKSLERGLFSPLSQLLADGQIVGDYFIVLLDAVNEHHPVLTTFLNCVFKLLPSWIKVVCTASSDAIHCIGLVRSSLDVFAVDDAEKQPLTNADVEAYINHRISSSGVVREQVAATRDALSKFKAALTANCGRCMLYLKKVFDLMESNALNMRMSTGSYRNALPADIHCLFELLCNQISHSSLAIFQDMRVILDVLITSPHPVTSEQLFLLVQSQSREQFERNLDLLSSNILIERTDGSFVFSSNTLRSWFHSQKLAGKYACNLRQGHALHAVFISRSSARLNASQTLDLCRHLTKAELFDSASAHLNYVWINLLSSNISASLAFLDFIYSPDLQIAKLLIEAGASVNALSTLENHPPVLSAHALLGNAHMVQLLIKSGADVNTVDKAGRSALCCACIRGDREIVDLLLRCPGVRVSPVDHSGMAAIEYAAQGGSLPIVQRLIGAATKASVERSLVLAAKNGRTQVVEFLLKGGFITNEALDSPLELLPGGVSETAMTAAASSGHNHTCEVLVKYGASLSARNNRDLTPLLAAVRANQDDIIIDLITMGADPAQTDQYGRTALILAAANGSATICEYLLINGSCISEVDNERLSALSWAAVRGHAEVAEVLLDEDADVNHRDNKGRSPLDLAAQYATGSDTALLSLLLEHGCELDGVCRDGMRPLDHAVVANNINCAALLLRQGAQIGKTAWKMAASNPQIMHLLLNKLTEDGSILYRQKKFELAQQRFAYALKKFPIDIHSLPGADIGTFRDLKVTIYLNISRCKRKLNKLEGAIHFATRALTVKPKCFEGYYARARAHRAAGLYPEALKDLKEAASLAPDNTEIQSMLQRVAMEAAVQSHAAAASSTPNHSTPFSAAANQGAAAAVLSSAAANHSVLSSVANHGEANNNIPPVKDTPL